MSVQGQERLLQKLPLVTQFSKLLGSEGPVVVTETLKSCAAIRDRTVFKLKKHMRDELQDLRSLRARYDNTLTEIDLNRRLAPDIYHGAVRVGCRSDGDLVQDDPSARTVEWPVKMRGLPDAEMLDVRIRDATSAARLQRDIDALVPILLALHRSADRTRAGLKSGLGSTPDRPLVDIYEARHAVMRARLSLAYLLRPVPRTAEKYAPLALRYLDFDDGRLCEFGGG